MGRRAMRIAACVALCAFVGGGSGVTAANAEVRSPSESPPTAATPVEGVIAPVPVASTTGTYIVLLEEEPAATYKGGLPGLAGTAPQDGEKLATHSEQMQEYTAFLRSRQREVADGAGVEPLATYQTVLNGFSAQLTPDAAARVAATEGVRALYPEDVLRPHGAPAADALRAKSQPGSAAPASAGDGVVVGVIDTGIAPRNPSFGGGPLGTDPTARAYLVGDSVVVPKPDGREFRSPRLTGDGWTRSDYSTKVVAAEYFDAGAAAAGFDFSHDVRSPRDSDGHGSLVASIAAGNAGIAVDIDGTSFGSISGAAPGAGIASYKACHVGHDPLSRADDICAGTDVLAALDRAVADGVDVLAFSLGAEQPEPGWGAVDIALFHTAMAGVFVAVSAGNAGPAPGTAHGGAPWYTTVAATTGATFGATVRLSDGFEALGVSASLRPGQQISAPIVYAGDAARDGSADAPLCYQGSLDPALVAGRIVVCDRGTNPREEKARAVADAGGMGMVLVNVAAGSLDAELDAVPTVHVDAAQRDLLLAAVASGATATLVGADRSDGPAQIATFSGRGPAADGSVLTPDVAAPGVSILGATADTAAGRPAWGLASGTSMAAPVIAGLAATYLAAHPGAMPDEIKSALMTTAGDAVDAGSSSAVGVFAQGAGAVAAGRVLDPGLLYLNGPEQWRDYLQERGSDGSDSSAMPGELNLASIAIPQLGQKHFVTRTLTAARAGTYRAAAAIPGVTATVEPATLTFSGPGEAKTFTVAFENASAPLGAWATGSLIWTEATDGSQVRSPMAVRPVAATATALVTGEGIEGGTRAHAVSGATGELAIEASGLAPVDLLIDPEDPAPGHSGDTSSGDEAGRIAWVVSVPADTALAEFSLAASARGAGLTAYRLAEPGGDGEQGLQRYAERFPAEVSGDQTRATLLDPEAGDYLVVVDLSGATDGTTWDLTSAVVPRAAGSLGVAAASSAVTAGQVVPYALSWAGLEPGRDYIGVVGYGPSATRTIVRVAAGAAGPRPDGAPVIAGDAVIGEELSVRAPGWDADDLSIAYRWMRDGEPIDGADESTYRVRRADAGSSLTAEVRAHQRGSVNAGIAVSEPVIVTAPSRLTVSMTRSVGTAADRYAVRVEVATAEGEPAAGTVTVHVDAAAYVGTLAGGTVTFVLPTPTPGIHVVVAEYGGSDGVSGSQGVTGFVVRE